MSFSNVETINIDCETINHTPVANLFGPTGPTGPAGGGGSVGTINKVQTSDGSGGFLDSGATIVSNVIDLYPTLPNTNVLGYVPGSHVLVLQAGFTGSTGGSIQILNTASSAAATINIINQSTGNNTWQGKANLSMINTISNNQIQVKVDEIYINEQDSGNYINLKGSTFEIHAGTTGGVLISSENNLYSVIVDNGGVKINGAFYLPEDSGSGGQILKSNGDGTTTWGFSS